MQDRNIAVTAGGSFFGCVLALWIGAGVAMTIWTDRTLDYWLSYLKGEAVDVHWFWSGLLSVIAAGPMFIMNIVSEIARPLM